MVVPVPPLPEEKLGANDIDIIACQRSVDGGSPTDRRTFGVRWGARPDLGWPLKPWRLERGFGSGEPHLVGEFHLPDSENWKVFEHDAESRRPRSGPYFAP